MALNRSLFSSESGEWETPQSLFDKLHVEFDFNFDPAALPGQYTAERIREAGGFACYPPDVPYYRVPFGWARDGLAQDWHGRVFLNPPYGRGISAWIEKAVQEVEKGNVEFVVALLPARTDTRWWQKNILRRTRMECAPPSAIALVWGRASEVRLLPGRLKFEGATNAAPFPSAIVVWRRSHD